MSIAIYERESGIEISVNRKRKPGQWWIEGDLPRELIGELAEMLGELCELREICQRKSFPDFLPSGPRRDVLSFALSRKGHPMEVTTATATDATDATAATAAAATAAAAATLKASRIAELKAAYPQGRVITFKGDPLILVLRRPSDVEVLTILDNSRLASQVSPGDNVYNYNNGTGEILQLVEVPERAEMQRLASTRPMIGHTLFREAMSLCRVPLAALPLTEEDKKKGASLGYLVNDKDRVLVRLITRAAYERLDFRRLKSDHKMLLPSWLAAVAKQNLVLPVGAEADELWERYPFLSNLIGQILFGETTLEVEEEEGK